MANSTVTDALTKIFLALGGDTQKLQDDHNLTDYLDDLGDALVEAVKAELPAVSSTDNGKVLKVTDGAWAKGNVPTELPAISGWADRGKVLTVKQSGSSYNWAAEKPCFNFGIIYDEEENYILDPEFEVTFSDITEAYRDDKILRCSFNLTGSSVSGFGFGMLVSFDEGTDEGQPILCIASYDAKYLCRISCNMELIEIENIT